MRKDWRTLGELLLWSEYLRHRKRCNFVCLCVFGRLYLKHKCRKEKQKLVLCSSEEVGRENKLLEGSCFFTGAE